jgi:tetratricopeptide (TPR) repeat protein
MQAGDVVADRFEVERLVRTGGMGAVFRARDRMTREPVALKALVQGAGVVPDRFLREGRVLAELRHPSIVRYVAPGVTAAGEAYLAMEWLDGEDLEQRLSREGLTVAESLGVVRRAAEALAAPHARGIVHRDIKPSNLFLVDGSLERIKLLDFGIARLHSATRLLTDNGVLLGTPGYMAPEQAIGERDVDPRADLFALGCVLYECLTGRAAFQAEHVMGVLAKIVLAPTPRVRALRPQLPQEIDDLIARLLAKMPSGRPADAATLVAEIDALGSFGKDMLRPTRESNEPRLTEREQRLVSIVVVRAHAMTADAADAPTLAMEDEQSSVERLRDVVSPFGARFDRLADGSLIAVLLGQSTAADQAAQAVRCALALRAALPDAPIVLATGRSVVAGSVPVGEVIDRAAFLMRAPGEHGTSPSIRLDDVTAGLLDARFAIDGDELGLVLIGERETADPARRLLGIETPCVGRDRELHMLSASIDDCASESVARAVIVTAPAGFGKSRVRHELLTALAKRREPLEVWLGRGNPMSAGSPFSLLGQALRRAAGIHDGESPLVRRQKLRARVARHVGEADRARVTEFLGELAFVPFPEAQSPQLRAARQEPMVMGDQMRRAWEDFLAAECDERPVVLVLEDLHWGDLPSVRFIDSALRNLHDRPIFVLALARPEIHELFPNLWRDRRVQEMRLEPLTRRASERLVIEALGDKATPELVARVVARSDGNAFYLEELIRAVAEGRGEALPETVIAMAQARLGALDGDARRILRAASVFGETFWLGGVGALLGGQRKNDSLRERLEDLAAREVISARAESKFAADREYVFRHALVREAAYAGLTESDRALGHQLAAAWLTRVGARDPMELAEHFERGGTPEQAIEWFNAAAMQALTGNDLVAALARAERAIVCGATGETLGALRLVQAEAHRWVGEFAEAERCGSSALESLPRGSALWFHAAGELVSAIGILGNHEELVALSESLRDATRDHPGAPGAIACARAVVQLLHAGKYKAAIALLDDLEAVAAPLVESDPAVAGWLGRARTILAGKEGDLELSRRSAGESVQALEAAGDLRTACLQRMNLGFGQNELGAYAEGEQTVRQALVLARRIGLHHVTAPGTTFLAAALAGQGKLHEGIAAAREAAAAFAAQGDRRMEAASRNHLARMLATTGEVSSAELEAHRAIDLCAALPPMRAASLGVLAEILLAVGRADEARIAASAGMEDMMQLGAIDQGEARLRLAHARALASTGDPEGARAAALAARDRLLDRAAKITDPKWRHSFLERVPENAQTMALAAQYMIRIPTEDW